MSSEDFKKTREINSLTQNKNTLISEIQAERKRISFIRGNREDRQDELNKASEKIKGFKSFMQKIENDIATTQKQLTNDQEHMNAVTSQEQLNGLESSIKHAQEKIETLENQGLELLEKIEAIEETIVDCENFLKGSAETLIEIEKEVEEFEHKHQRKIETLNTRISLLMGALPPLFQDRIKRVFEKNINISSFTRIMNGSCEFCKFAVNKIDETNIEDKLQLKSCQSCGRIFIPQQASY